MTEQEMREIFREMRDESVPADSLARVRAGVAQRVSRRRWVFPWKIATALVMAGGIVAGIFLLKPAKTVPQPKTVEIAQAVPSSPAPVEESPVRAVPRPRRAARPQRAVEVVPVSIRIETPDPDVVILLVN